MPKTPSTLWGKPAVVGLAGFGLTTMILQLHHLELCSIGPVIGCGLVFGGLAQLIAGFQEMKVGNNFGYSVFVSYGAFWIALCLMLLFSRYEIYTATKKEIGFFLIVWTLYTAILWVAALRIHGAMASTFSLLLFGLILQDLAHFGYPPMAKVGAYVLIFCALNAWYIVAHQILLQIYGRDVLPVGKPWINSPKAETSQVPHVETSR